MPMNLAEFQKKTLTRRFEKAGLRSSTLRGRGFHVHCWVGLEDKPPLMLIHGFGGSAIWQWYPQVRWLSKYYKLIIPDLLCFGGSDCELGMLSLRKQGEALMMVADQLGLEKFGVAGISYGGFVSYLMASRWPGRIEKVALIACPATAITARDFNQVLADFGVQSITEILLPTEPEMVRRLLQIAWARPPRVPSFILKQVHALLFQDRVTQKEKLINELTSYIDHIPSLPPSQSHETLIVWGEHDKIFPLYLGHRLKDYLGDRASIEVIQGAAHAPNHEGKKRFNDVVHQFFSGGAEATTGP